MILDCTFTNFRDNPKKHSSELLCTLGGFYDLVNMWQQNANQSKSVWKSDVWCPSLPAHLRIILNSMSSNHQIAKPLTIHRLSQSRSTQLHAGIRMSNRRHPVRGWVLSGDAIHADFHNCTCSTPIFTFVWAIGIPLCYTGWFFFYWPVFRKI